MSRYKDLIWVGLVKEISTGCNLPSIHNLVHKPMKEKETVLRYMKSCENIAWAPGIMRDVFDPEIWSSKLSLMSDGKYQWRSDVIYYVEKYDMELLREFVEHVLEKERQGWKGERIPFD